jgi:hypothetical protein
MSVVGTLAVVGNLAACGGSTKEIQDVPTSAASGKTTTAVSAHTPSSRQAIVRSAACLKREGVRPAMHAVYRLRVPRGAGEVMRYGVPMTAEEFEAAVRRCVARSKSADVSARRK